MTSEYHPSVAEKLQFFEYAHLPEPLQSISQKSAELAQDIADSIESSSQLTLGLQKLIEAKDCFVRAAVSQRNKEKGEEKLGKPIN